MFYREESMKKKQRRLKAGKLSKEDFNAAVARYQDQTFKQEALIFVALHLLLNLSEDNRVMIKMTSKVFCAT